MKILVNALSAKKGGIVTYTRNLQEAFISRGIDSTIAVPKGFEGNSGGSIFNLDVADYSPPHRLIWEQTSWRRIVKRVNPDILFSSANFGLLYSPVPQILLLREGGLFDPFYLANMTAEQGVALAFSRSMRRRLMLASARRADHIMTPTKAMRDMVAKWSPELVQKCSVNPYGTLIARFKPIEPKRAWRADGMLRILYVSVYYPHKVPALVCQVVEQLKKEGIPSHATITMSPNEFGEMRGGVVDQKIVVDACKRGFVTLGRHDYDKLPNLYRSHDIFVFPSVSETFGHPMAEAMSSGLPVIAADTQTNKEICGEAGLFFEPFSVSQSAALVHRLDGDPQLRQRMAEKGRERVTENFGWEHHIDRLIDSFEHLIETSSKSASAGK